MLPSDAEEAIHFSYSVLEQELASSTVPNFKDTPTLLALTAECTSHPVVGACVPTAQHQIPSQLWGRVFSYLGKMEARQHIKASQGPSALTEGQDRTSWGWRLLCS